MLNRVVWTAVGAFLLMIGAILAATLLPDQGTLALVMIGSSISLAVLSHRET